jgi:hypothetical protein
MPRLNELNDPCFGRSSWKLGFYGVFQFRATEDVVLAYNEETELCSRSQLQLRVARFSLGGGLRAGRLLRLRR